MDVLRPQSTTTRNEQLDRLYRKGFYPISVLPREVILRIPIETGPKLTNTGILPKQSGGNVADYSSGTRDSGVGGTCSWGPVVYVVLWKSAVRSKPHGYSMKNFADDIQRVKHSASLQMAVLSTYKMQHLPADPARDTIRLAIDAALDRLTKETQT